MIKYRIPKYFIIFLLFSVVIFSQEKRKYLWFDATANFERLSYLDSIKYYLEKSKDVGFTDIVIDVKPISGEVLFKSKIAPQMVDWQNKSRNKDLDLLKICIAEGHKLGLRIHAGLNIFVGGHNYFDRGIVYSDSQKFDWASILYTDSGFVNIKDLKHKYSAMLNPVRTDVRKYQLNIISEVVKNYKNLDGIILDRARFDGIEADFSEYSKRNFIKYIRDNKINWPDDILVWEKDKVKKYKEGKYFKKWLEWRAKNIYDFVKEARHLVKKLNPKLEYQIYVGAWYPVYFDVGVNWASKKFDVSKKYDWATEQYKNFGYAELFDVILTGNYFFEVEKSEVEKLNENLIKRNEAGMGNTKDFWYSVEGSAEVVNEVMMNSTTVISSLYVEQYNGNPEQFKKAIKKCLEMSKGIMIFDLVHIVNYGWWHLFDWK